MKVATALLLLVAAPVLAQSDAPAGHDATVRHAFDDAKRWAEVFDAPDRGEWQRPQVVTRVLTVDRGQHVADIGAGTGYFTRILAADVGKSGKVYAVDIEPAMLEHIRQDEGMRQWGNVETVLAAPDDPKLPDAELDLILVVNTWHHIDDRLSYLPRLARALKPGGRVAVIDWHEGELPKGPPAGHKLSRAAVVAEFAEVGWTLISESTALPYQYFLVFVPPRG